MNTDVLLFAAGRGERLRPYTDQQPKPLLEVGGKPLIAWNLELLERCGAQRVIINTCYLADKLEEYLRHYPTNMVVETVREATLLDTGGTIKNIEPLLRHDTLLTMNSDTIYSPGFVLQKVLDNHRQSKTSPLLTMVLGGDSDLGYFGGIGVDRDNRVVAFRGEQLVAGQIHEQLIYSGISLINTEVIKRMPPRGTVFSLTRDTIRNLLVEQAPIVAYRYSGYWNDVGTPAALKKANDDFKAGRIV